MRALVSRRSLTLAALAACVAITVALRAQAADQQSPAPSMQELEAIQQQIDQGKIQAGELNRQAEQLAKDVARLQRQLIQSAADVQSAEEQATGLEDDLEELTAREAARSSELAQKPRSAANPAVPGASVMWRVAVSRAIDQRGCGALCRRNTYGASGEKARPSWEIMFIPMMAALERPLEATDQAPKNSAPRADARIINVPRMGSGLPSAVVRPNGSGMRSTTAWAALAALKARRERTDGAAPVSNRQGSVCAVAPSPKVNAMWGREPSC